MSNAEIELRCGGQQLDTRADTTPGSRGGGVVLEKLVVL